MPELTVEVPIDLVHLARYTGGDRQLNCEVFLLFSDQCVSSIHSLRTGLDMADEKGWRDTAHALKGAASGIGAFALAESAGIAEGLNPQRDPARAAELLGILGHHSEVVLGYIEAYLASG